MAAASATAGSTKMLHTSLDSFAKMADLSWISTLCEDPEGKKHVPNDKMRPVRSGHYVLTEPKVICIKKKMALCIAVCAVWYYLPTLSF